MFGTKGISTNFSSPNLAAFSLFQSENQSPKRTSPAPNSADQNNAVYTTIGRVAFVSAAAAIVAWLVQGNQAK